MFNNAEIAKEVDELVDGIFSDNKDSKDELVDEIKWLVYLVLLENTEYLRELVELGEYLINDEGEVTKCILSSKDINIKPPTTVVVECPKCNSTLEVTL